MIRARLSLPSAVLLSLLLGACPNNNPVECLDQSACNSGADGQCTLNSATGSTWCSYADGTCPSGRRWSSVSVGDGLSGTCVSAPVDAGLPDAPGTDTTPPTIVSKSPDAGATGVGVMATVSIQFSEPIAPA